MRTPLRRRRAHLLTLLLAPLLLPAAAGAQQEPVITQAGASYALRPGDIIRITVWGQEEYSGQFQVDETGAVHYPVLGEIDTRGMTVAALRERIRSGLETLFTTPFITITPLFRIAVLGHVRNPGLYTVDPTLSVLDIVALAGGATDVGNLGKIRLLRPGSETRVSFEEESTRGRALQEIGIRSGDQILVPRRFFTRQDFGILLALAQIGLSIAIFVNTVN